MPLSHTSNLFFLYGPSGSGKTSVGRYLAQALGLPFTDLDSLIETRIGKTVPDIFATEGETVFRQYERSALLEKINQGYGVVALGGGALVDEQNRKDAEEAGRILYLDASLEELEKRLGKDASQRPLLRNNTDDLHARLEGLLSRRAEHYASFTTRVNTNGLGCEEVGWQAQVRLGAFNITGMGDPYDLRVENNGLDHLGNMMAARGLKGPIALVADSNVMARHGDRAEAALIKAEYTVHKIVIPPGEANKTLETISKLWQLFLKLGLERSSTVVALGGGVVSDLAGFAASTYLRGCRWVVAPTSLLSMADASLGGKTGFDLPEGKNLIGSFYPPCLVMSDPNTLFTLPEEELRNGMGEVVKAAIVLDKTLYKLCKQPWKDIIQNTSIWEELVRRSGAVKVKVITQDPYEAGIRAALNLGHTIGHGLEQASRFSLNHGEAVAIGMVIEANISERIGLAQPGLAGEIAETLAGLGLPTTLPAGIDHRAVLKAMSHDKKKAEGKVRFALPVDIGEVKTGVTLDLNEDLLGSI